MSSWALNPRFSRHTMQGLRRAHLIPSTFEIKERNHHEPHTVMECDARRRASRLLLDRPDAIECRLPPVAPLSLPIRARMGEHYTRG
jgi:hypothetical protein